jgi:glycogen synthase
LCRYNEENTEWFPALRWRWNDGGESMNFLKAGLATSSAAVLVSPSYCEEVQTNELGCGMDKVLRSVGNFDVGLGVGVNLGWLNGMSGRLNGIVNGIDTEEWNPATDPHIPFNYSVDVPAPEERRLHDPASSSASSAAAADDAGSEFCTSAAADGSIYADSEACLLLAAKQAGAADAGANANANANWECLEYCGGDGVHGGVLDYRRGKAECKAALQRELGLHEDPDAPLVGFIGRLDQQKGVDVLLRVVPHIVANGGQVVMLGSGDEQLEGMMRQMEHDHRQGWHFSPRYFAVKTRFN